MKTFLSFLLAVTLIASNISAQQFAGIDVLSTDVTSNGQSTTNDFLLPFADPNAAVTQDQKACLPFQNVPLNPAFSIKMLPTSDQSLYCLLRPVESDIRAGYRFETDDLSEGIYSVSLIGKEAVGTRTIFISGR